MDYFLNMLLKFGSEIKHVWVEGVFGYDVGAMLTAVIIFVGFLLFRGLFTRYVLDRLHVITEKTSTRLDDAIVDALLPPIRFLPIVLGIFFSGHYLDADELAPQFFQPLTRSLIAFTLFWALHRSLQPISDGLKPLQRLLTPLMVRWIFRIARTLVLFIGAAVVLEVWGIAVAPLLAGLGLFGAAIALGAQDLFKNLIGGITIIAEKRFEPGEWIHVDGVVEGVVEDINFRSTLVRRFDKAPVHVPNTLLSDSVVTNFSRMTHRRIKWYVGVTYDTSVDQLKIIRDEIADYIDGHEAFASSDEVSTFVRVDRFDDSAITFMIYCFTKTTKWGEWLAIKEEFACAIKEIIEEKAGSSFAFPSQSIYVESLPEAYETVKS